MVKLLSEALARSHFLVKKGFLSEDLARPNSVRYRGSKYQHFDRVASMRCLFCPRKYRRRSTVPHCIHIASCQIDASTASVAAAKNKTTATAKITGILWRAVAKATGAPSAALFGVCCRSIEHISKMLSLRDSVGNHPLLISLK